MHLLELGFRSVDHILALVPGRLGEDRTCAGRGSSVILLRPFSPFSRHFNTDGDRASAKRLASRRRLIEPRPRRAFDRFALNSRSRACMRKGVCATKEMTCR